MRREFGIARTSCGCAECQLNCRHMPGMLIPSDLDRLAPVPEGEAAVLAWAEANLLASPGALVAQGGRTFRIPTLVPATKADGSCVHLGEDGRCAIHAVAPFGCAFFSCGPDPGIAGDGLREIARAHTAGGLYTRVWERLWLLGRRQERPDVLRERMAKALDWGCTCGYANPASEGRCQSCGRGHL